MSPRDCLLSFFTTVSNETVNVITHFGPLVVLAAAAFDPAWSALPSHFALSRMYVMATTLTMLGSVSYHMFMAACGTKAAYEALLFADVCGIWVAGSALSIVVVMVGFTSVPLWLKVALLTVVLGACFLQLWWAKSAKERALSLSIQALFRMALNALRVAYDGGNTSAATVSWLRPTVTAGAVPLLIGEVIMVVAAFINVKRYPERALAARYPILNVIGNSHQVW